MAGSSVFALVTSLCEKIGDKEPRADRTIPKNRRLLKKMRSKAFEILLNKAAVARSSDEIVEPTLDMLTYYFKKSASRKNLNDYYDLVELKEQIDWIIDSKAEENDPCFRQILTVVVDLRNSVPNGGEKRLFEHPFSVGKLDQILPPVAYVDKNDPKPYQHYPCEIFNIPFNITDKIDHINGDSTLYPYDLNVFSSKPGTNLAYFGSMGIFRLNSLSSNRDSKQSSLYSKSLEEIQTYPRLFEPRDLTIPADDKKEFQDKKKIVNKANLSEEKFNMESGPTATLWELASMDIHCKFDIWEEASKMPYIERRNFISSSVNQMYHWRQNNKNKIDQLHIISESEFILHLKYLTIGIESDSFYFNNTNGKFAMRPGLCVEGLLPITLKIYLNDPLIIGTCYLKLNNLVSSSNSEAIFYEDSLIFKALCEHIRKYMSCFRLEIDEIFGDSLMTVGSVQKKIPTLIEVVKKLKKISNEIKTMMRVFEVYQRENADKNLRGAGLLACLYNEITIITQPNVSSILYSTLQATCNVYFRFIQRFIFEGEIDDDFEEFFIKKDNQYILSYNKKYWNKGFIIGNDEIVPEFLKGMAKYILLCGKSLRLLKLCNPDDPLCVMLSSAYPQIKCCMTFKEIESQKVLFDQYRMQCLYVCGEPITFQNLMMQRETEKRAFREMIALKQVETMEKLIEERKRLSRMLQINKKQQFAALQEAAEKARDKKKQEKLQSIKEDELNMQYLKAIDDVQKLKMEEEKRKVSEFYNEIEKEVNKRQMMADWKIKRLRLDQKRLQLISCEKFNLDRENYELHSVHNKENINESSSFPDRTEEANNTLLNILDIESSENKINCSPLINNNREEIYEIEDIQKPNKNIVSMDNMTDIINSNVANNLLDIENNANLSASDIVNRNMLSQTDVMYNNYKSQKEEAYNNKMKILSHEFGIDATLSSPQNILPDPNYNSQILSVINNNFSDAQKNKLKVLGSNFNADIVISDNNLNEIPQYNTEASREALRNKQKILGHEYGIEINKKQPIKSRDNLTLDLKKCNRPLLTNWADKNTCKLSKNVLTFDITPSSCLNTPGDINLKFDIETPSTFDVEPFGIQSATTMSPTSARIEESHEIYDSSKKGFKFPDIIEDYISDEETVPDGTSNLAQTTDYKEVDLPHSHPRIWNFSNGELNFDDFKPFGIKSTVDNKFETMEIFDHIFNLAGDGKSPYTDIIDIISQAEKKPSSDLFKIIPLDEMQNLLEKIENVDLSTIATCLQRSVMIPLSCQMEMVNNATLKYFLVNCDLYDHLKNIRDYFFLMDGEFSKTFCLNLFDKLNITECPKELLNYATLHAILDKSYGSITSGANKHSENLSFIINDMPISFHHNSPDVLECLTLSYNVAWPLNIILSQEAMERYVKVFKFLVKLRRVSWVLERDSEVLKMALKEEFMVSKELLRSPQYHSIQLYRYIMSSLIRALHSYIFTTCLLLSWSEFENDLNNARTLDDLYSVHVIYIKKVLFRCLLNNRSSSVMKVLNDMFCVILRFHYLLHARCWHIAENEIHYTHPLFSQIREQFVTFEKLSKYFYKMIRKLTDCGYQPHLSELLSVINFNNYYKGSKI